MRISQDTLTRGAKDARNFKQANKEMCKDTDIVNAYVRAEDDVYTHETTDKSDKKLHVNQQDKCLPETWKLSKGNYSSMYAAGNLLYCDRSIQGMVLPESGFVKAYARHRQYSQNSYRGIKYNPAQDYTSKRYYTNNKKHYEDNSSGNVSNTARLEFANGDSRNTFVSMVANKARCKAKVGAFLYNKYTDETGASKFQNSAQKGCAGPLNANRNNSRYLDDSGSDADEDGGEVEDSSVEDSKTEDIKRDDSKCEGSKSEELDSGEGMRSASSVTSEVCYSKFDSENNESKYGSTEGHTECQDVYDDSSQEADDTVCSVDFENISGSVFWSEDASNDNHIDGVDDIHNHDDNKDTTYCENTLNEEGNNFFVLNCAPMNAGQNCKHHSPSYVGLLTGQSVTNSDGENATFLDNAEDILEHSVFNEAMTPILTRGRSSLPLKIMSLTSNNFDNYRRMFEAFKTRIFPNANETDSENCDRRKDGGCLRRCVSVVDNDSAEENSRMLQLSSSNSEIYNNDHNSDNERSTQNSDKEVEETDRILPAWCDWEAEFDYVNSDYLKARSPKDHTIVRCEEVEHQVKGNSLGQADVGKNRHDLGKQLKAATSKHFSSCMQKKGSRTSLAHQRKKVNNIRKSTTEVSAKKKLINFKFQGPPKHDANQYMNNSLEAGFADNNLPNEAADQDVFNQTSTVTIVARKPMSRLSAENQNVVIARHTEEVEDSRIMEIIHKDTHREHPLGMRKNTLENSDSFQEAEDSQVTEIVPKDTACDPDLNIRKETLNNGNRERTKGRNYTEDTKQLQPCDDSVYSAEQPDFKTSPEVKQEDSDTTSDSVDQEYSTPEEHHRSVVTEHSLEQTQQEKTKKTDDGTHKRLPLSEFDNNARGTVRSSAEIPTDNINRVTKSEEKKTESDTCDGYLLDQQLSSITPEKTTVRPKETRRNFRDVFKVADTRRQRDTQNEARMGRLTTSIPTVFKVMSELSLKSVPSEQIIIRPKYTVFASKARKRRLDTRKGGKSKDHSHQQKKWLGKHYTQGTKPRKSSSQSKSEKSRSEKYLTNVPRINTECIFPIPALASSREHKCYLKYHNRDTMRNIGHTYSTGLAMDQTVTGSTRPSTVKSDESLTAHVDEMNQEHPRFAAEDLEADVFIFNKNDYYYYVQPMRSPEWPDSGADVSIYNPDRSISNSKDPHSVSDIYFTDIPIRVVSRTQITESSPKSSQSLTDTYFSNSRSKYELVDETTYTEAQYEHYDADMPHDQDVFSREGSLNSSTDVKDHSSGELHNSSYEDMIFFDDCLLELINKRAVTNTANQDTAKICCRDDDSSEMNNSVPNLKQTLTISDLLAESICLPADANNLVDTILPEVSLIQDSEHNVRNRHTSKRKRAKRNSDQNILTPPHGEPSLDENENTENMQFGYDKTPSCQESMAGGNVAQSLVLAATEDNSVEAKLVNYEYHNFEEFHRSHKDHRNEVKSSNLESNTPWHIGQPSTMPEHSRTAESHQFINNEPNAYAIQHMSNEELCSQYSYDCEDNANEGDVYEFDSNLKHKVALLLQRIEDTNCIKIVSTQEFYKNKHGAASFINDVAKMIDENLERCNDGPQEKIVHGHSVAAQELVVARTPRKVPRKEKAYTQREEGRAKKAPDSGAEGKQVYENKHKQGLCAGHADGDEVKDMETMGCLARHVRKQISAMHRYNNNEGMAVLKQDNTLCAYTHDHRSTKEINQELRTTGKAVSKGSARNENKRVHEDIGIVQRLVESAAEKCDKNCNINLVCLAAEGEQTIGSNSYNKLQSAEGKKVLPDMIHYNLHNKMIYSDCSDGSIITESNQSDYNQEDKSQKVNTDDYYDSDSNNVTLVSSMSSVLTSRDADIIPKCQLRLKDDLQCDGFRARKDTPGSKMRQRQPSASRTTPKVRKPHQNSQVVLQQGNPQTEYTCTNVHLAKNSENETLCEGAKNESNGKNANLFSGLKDSSRLKVANFPLKNTSSDIGYWEEDVARDTKVDVTCLQTDEQKLDHEYEQYKRYPRCIDASSHTKEKALKTTGTQYDQPAMAVAEESKHTYTLASGADSSTDIYYNNKDKLSVSGSDQDLSDGSSSYQIQKEETLLSDQRIPQVPSYTKCHKISPPIARSDYPKPKKNVTFQEDDSRESNTQSTTNKQTYIDHNDGLISDNRRTADPQGSRVHNKEYLSRVFRTNATVVNSSQQTNPVKRCTNTTPQERGDRSPKPCLYSWDNSDDREISRPGFVSYIHKHRRQKSESAATKEISSTDTECSQQSKDNKPTCGQTKGTITHEPSCTDNQSLRIGIDRKESQTNKGIIQNPNISQRTDMTHVGFRRDTGQNKSPTGGHRSAKEDCVKHSIASLNSNDRSGGRVQNYADIVNKPLFSLTSSPKASVEYAISGKSKLEESNKKKVVPSPRVDLGSTYLQRGQGGPEVAKQAFEVVSGGIKVAGIEHDVAKSGLKFARNEHEVARSGFNMLKNEPSVARNDHSFQGTAKHMWQIGNLSMPNKVDSGKRRSISPFSLTPTRDWEVNASRSVSCHDMRVNSQTKQHVMQGSDQQSSKQRSNYTVSYPSPTCITPKRNYKGLLHNQTLGSEIVVAPTFLSSVSLRGNSKDSESLMSSKSLRGNSKDSESLISNKSLRGNSKDSESLMSNKSLRGNSKKSETLMSSKSLRGNSKNSETLVFSQSFRGNPRDNDDLSGRREYSSEGYFIPENDDDYQEGNTRYLMGLDHLTERFSPELKRRNSLPEYDFQERYHNSHSPRERPMITSRQNIFASTRARNTRESEQRGVLRPESDAALEKAYLENKQQELQKGFQNYWSERMKMRKEEFERIRQEYRPGLRSTEEAVVLFQNDNLPGKRSLVNEKVPRKTVRPGMDKSSRKTTLSETGKTHRKKTAPEIDKFSRKTPRSSLAAQPPLRLSDVDVEVHRVDSSTVQRMRNQSKERAIELPRHKFPEFPGKDLFKFAHKALLGSTFQAERVPSTGRIQEQPKDVHENRSPGLLSRIINSFSRSDRVHFMTGRGNEARPGCSKPKQRLLGTDGSGEGFVSVAGMRGQVAKTSHYSANAGIHHRNKRRQSHSPQMSILGLRELRSDYNQNMNSNAKSLARQCLRRTNSVRVLSNIRAVRNKVIKKPTSTVLRKHLNIPILFPLKSKEVSNIHKKRKQSPSCVFLVPRNDAIEMNSYKLHNHFTKTGTEPRVTVNITTSVASTGRTYILLMLLLALSLSMLYSACLMRPSFRSSLSAGEQTFPPQERHSSEAELSLWRAVSLVGSL